jgi:predicted nucleotidyltransferase
LRRPRAYSEVGYILWEQGVLSRHDAEMLRSMAGLRNVLVHAYARVDRGRIFEFAERLKMDARRVASAVLKGVEGKPIDPPADSAAGMVEKLKRALSGKVVLALLYGGQAKGYALKGDYDVAVLMEQGCDLYKLGELVVDVAEALGVPEELVDVVCIDALPPEHALEALSGAPVIVGDPALLLDLKLKTLQQLLDLRARTHIPPPSIGGGAPELPPGSGHGLGASRRFTASSAPRAGARGGGSPSGGASPGKRGERGPAERHALRPLHCVLFYRVFPAAHGLKSKVRAYKPFPE